MADNNTQLKRFNGSSWDNINPKTTWANVSGKPSTYPPSAHTHTKSQITDFAHTHGNADLVELASWAKQANKPSYNFNEINNRGEAYLEWGGTNRSGDIDPLAMSISAEHSANRIAFLNGDAISMEYSSDGGTTWTDYEYSSNAKSEFCTTTYSVPIGRSSGSTECTTSMRTRITLTGCNGSTTFVYTDPRKLLIRMSTANSVEVDIEYKTGEEGASWQQYGTYRVSGWSGWNSIPLVLGTFGGGTTQYSNNWYLRFTFRITALYESYKRYSEVMAIRLFGTNCWVSSSYASGKGVMSETGHMYTYDIDGNVTFPKFIQGTFNGQYNKAAFKWRDDGSGYKTGIYYGTAGNECLTFGTNQSYTGIQFINGIDVDNMNSATWQSTTSDLMIKDKKVYINYKYNDGLPDYKLNVNGTANATTLYEGGTALSSKYAPLSYFNDGGAKRLTSLDERSTTTTPQTTLNGIRATFKDNSTDGLNDGGGYHGVMHWRSYSTGTDMSGGYPVEIGYTANNNLWMRIGTGLDTWGDWTKFAKTRNESFTGSTQFTSNSEGSPFVMNYNIDNDYGMQVNVTNEDGDYTHHIDFYGDAGDEYEIVVPAKSGTLAIDSEVASSIAISNGYIQLKNSSGTVISQVQLPTYNGEVV